MGDSAESDPESLSFDEYLYCLDLHLLGRSQGSLDSYHRKFTKLQQLDRILRRGTKFTVVFQKIGPSQGVSLSIFTESLWFLDIPSASHEWVRVRAVRVPVFAQRKPSRRFRAILLHGLLLDGPKSFWDHLVSSNLSRWNAGIKRWLV